MRKINKSFMMVLVIILTVFLACGCGKSQDTSCREVLNNVIKDFPEEFNTVASFGESLYDDSFDNMYGVEYKMINDGAICYLEEGNTASEVSIMHLKKSEDINIAKQKLGDRVQTRRNAFAGYLPEEVSKIDNYNIIVQGDFVCLIIAEDPAMVESSVRAGISTK